MSEEKRGNKFIDKILEESVKTGKFVELKDVLRNLAELCGKETVLHKWSDFADRIADWILDKIVLKYDVERRWYRPVKTPRLEDLSAYFVRGLRIVKGSSVEMLKKDLKCMEVEWTKIIGYGIEFKKIKEELKRGEIGRLEKINIYEKDGRKICEIESGLVDEYLRKRKLESIPYPLKSALCKVYELKQLLPSDIIKNPMILKEPDIEENLNYQERTALNMFCYILTGVKPALAVKRYKSVYGRECFFTVKDRYFILEELYKKLVEEDENEWWFKKVRAGIITQHEICARAEGLVRAEIQLFPNPRVGIIKTIEKRGLTWTRPMKMEWFSLVSSYLPFSEKELSDYSKTLVRIYLRVINRLIDEGELKIYSLTSRAISFFEKFNVPYSRKDGYYYVKVDSSGFREIIKVFRKDRGEDKDFAVGRSALKFHEVFPFLSLKWCYALFRPTHIWRHTCAQSWCMEVGYDIRFIHAMGWTDPGIFINIYGSMPLGELVQVVLGETTKEPHDFLYGDYFKMAKEKGYLNP